MKVIGYLRVSTEYQDAENQKLGILELANRNNLGAVIFVEENIPSTVANVVSHVRLEFSGASGITRH